MAQLIGTPETLVSSQIQVTECSRLTDSLLFTNVNNIDQGTVSSLVCVLLAQEHFVSQVSFARISSPTLWVDFFFFFFPLRLPTPDMPAPNSLWSRVIPEL